MNSHVAIADKASFQQLFAYPFRVFFLSMTLLALINVPLWVLIVTGTVELPLVMPGLFWHQHEMLFGFLAAAIAGFLLTAVCVWTKTDRTHGWRLFVLWLVWLAGRLLLMCGATLPLWLVQGVNLAFIPLVILDAGWRIGQAKQKRQYPILLILSLFWLMQIGYVLQLDSRYSQGALIMALALISIIGGRITPAFSGGWMNRNGLNATAIKTVPLVDQATTISLVMLLLSLLVGQHMFAGALAIVAAIMMAVRLLGWKGWLMYQEPLLWILHLSIVWVPVALVLLAGTLLAGWPVTAWTHAAGTGAIGCLVLGVISRVSLGHTGRPLVLPLGMVMAFVAIHIAALVRVFTALGWAPWHAGIGISAGLWMLAYGLFLLRYTTILASPRPDGKVG